LTKKTKKVNKVSNKKFAEENKPFNEACEGAGCEPTTRQASKFRNKKGIAYMYLNNLLP
jgi:hypothetical protein